MTALPNDLLHRTHVSSIHASVFHHFNQAASLPVLVLKATEG
jgi:hypothetical protein